MQVSYKLMHDPQNCPHCGEEVTPLTSGVIPQRHGFLLAYVTNATCPECAGKWLTQLVKGA